MDGIRSLDAATVIVAMLVNVAATVCCAWRWHLVAQGLGFDLPKRQAFSAYYRSQFINATLPGGVVGDVERAVRHGRDAGSLSGGMRAVGWERGVGLVVQLGLTALLLLVLPSPVRPSATAVVIAVLVIALVVAAGAAVVRYTRSDAVRPGSRRERILGTAVADVRDGVLARGHWWLLVLLSAAVLAAHLTIFLLAAHAAGGVSPATAVPLGLVVLAASTIPLSFAGWGPREGVAAWVFAAAGLGAATGVTVSAAYGVLVLLVTLPGAVVLFAGRYLPGLRTPGQATDAPGPHRDPVPSSPAASPAAVVPPAAAVPLAGLAREVTVDG